MQRESLEERSSKVFLIAIKHIVWLWTGLTWSGSEGLFLVVLGDRQTHWRVERSAGGRHGGVQGVPDGHWGHLIHKPALTHRLDNWGTFKLFNSIMFLLMKQVSFQLSFMFEKEKTKKVFDVWGEVMIISYILKLASQPCFIIFPIIEIDVAVICCSIKLIFLNQFEDKASH